MGYTGGAPLAMPAELYAQPAKLYEPKIIPKSKENYVSVQIGCLRFLHSYRFLPSSLDKLIKSLDSFPLLDENGFVDEILKKKLAYPYEKFNLENINQSLNLTKEDFYSTLKQETPPQEQIDRTQEIIKKFNVKTGIYLKSCS